MIKKKKVSSPLVKAVLECIMQTAADRHHALYCIVHSVLSLEEIILQLVTGALQQDKANKLASVCWEYRWRCLVTSCTWDSVLYSALFVVLQSWEKKERKGRKKKYAHTWKLMDSHDWTSVTQLPVTTAPSVGFSHLTVPSRVKDHEMIGDGPVFPDGWLWAEWLHCSLYEDVLKTQMD